jgi:hypothetical protein
MPFNPRITSLPELAVKESFEDEPVSSSSLDVPVFFAIVVSPSIDHQTAYVSDELTNFNKFFGR